MREISVHEFRSHLRETVEEVMGDHVPLRVKRRGGGDFVVVSAEDWSGSRRRCTFSRTNRSWSRSSVR